MTGFLIKLFVKQNEQVQKPEVRTAYGRLSGVVGILCNVLLFAGKFLVGTLTASVSITADAFNNLSDASSGLVSLLGFKMASRPADEEHPYGHARYEYLAGLTVCVMILVIGVELLKESFSKILHPEAVEFSWISVAILLISIGLKLWLAFFNRTLGKKINSQTLLATAADSRNDVITTSAVLLAMVLSYVTKLELDGFAGLVVALFILYSGVGLIRETLDPLLGKAADEELVLDIQQRILSYPGVLGTHDLMIHDYGPGRQFGSVHVEVAAEDDVIGSHDMVDNIERDMKEQLNLNMVVHMDPIVTKDESVNNLRHWLAQEVKKVHPDLTIHDMRVVPGTTHTNVIFDCLVPRGLKQSDEEIKEAIDRLVKQTYPNYYCVITVDHSYASVTK
ncbi:MAG: cation diffusion facilitator family transporter [Lachnospiraceae bacterium]|nr:cation diffusion facilitator family transporter [Lachnospiraceae bacterium]